MFRVRRHCGLTERDAGELARKFMIDVAVMCFIGTRDQHDIAECRVVSELQ